jgi:hypothetical protein
MDNNHDLEVNHCVGDMINAKDENGTNWPAKILGFQGKQLIVECDSRPRMVYKLQRRNVLKKEKRGCALDMDGVSYEEVEEDLPKKKRLYTLVDQVYYEVEYICDRRINCITDRVEYLVKWKHYDYSEKTWEPVKVLSKNKLVRKDIAEWLKRKRRDTDYDSSDDEQVLERLKFLLE